MHEGLGPRFSINGHYRTTYLPPNPSRPFSQEQVDLKTLISQSIESMELFAVNPRFEPHIWTLEPWSNANALSFENKLIEILRKINMALDKKINVWPEFIRIYDFLENSIPRYNIIPVKKTSEYQNLQERAIRICITEKIDDIENYVGVPFKSPCDYQRIRFNKIMPAVAFDLAMGLLWEQPISNEVQRYIQIVNSAPRKGFNMNAIPADPGKVSVPPREYIGNRLDKQYLNFRTSCEFVQN
jgi:hypothetical protein